MCQLLIQKGPTKGGGSTEAGCKILMKLPFTNHWSIKVGIAYSV